MNLAIDHMSVDLPARRAVLGDYNGNGVVDMADYVLWRNGGPLQNDATPGTVDASDYNVWRSFGNHAGSGSSVGSASAVPEPGTFCLAAFGLFVFGGCSRTRQMAGGDKPELFAHGR